MSHLEPPDPIETSCPDCGEEDQIEHVDGAQWFCLVCKYTFSDNPL